MCASLMSKSVSVRTDAPSLPHREVGRGTIVRGRGYQLQCVEPSSDVAIDADLHRPHARNVEDVPGSFWVPFEPHETPKNHIQQVERLGSIAVMPGMITGIHNK